MSSAIRGSLLAEIDRLQVQLGPRDARILQQIINHLPHLPTEGDDPLGITAAFLAENPSVLLKQELAVTTERPQRSPQVVGKRYR